MWLVFVGSRWEPVEAVLSQVGEEVVLVLSREIAPKEAKGWKGKKEVVSYTLKDVLRVIGKYQRGRLVPKVNGVGLPKEVFLGLFLLSLRRDDASVGFDLYTMNVNKSLSKVNAAKLIKDLLCTRGRRRAKLRTRILDYLAKEKSGAKVVEVAKALGKSPSLVIRSLRYLEKEGIVERKNGRYVLNPLWGEIVRSLHLELEGV